MLELILVALGTLTNPTTPVHFIQHSTRFGAQQGFEVDVPTGNVWDAMPAAAEQLPVGVEYWVPEISCPVTVQANGYLSVGDCEG